MKYTKVCPKNQAEVNQASKRLECGYDKYGNNQYMCLPNKDKTSLVEFCNNGVMGFTEKGHCLEVSSERIIRHSCSTFADGCPDGPFLLSDVHKYPACQEINTQLKCYVADLTCTLKGPSEEQYDVGKIVGILIAALVLVFICIAIKCFQETRRKTCRKDTTCTTEQENVALNDDNKMANPA